jgi:diguanylate cyclase (GGDEF)-like protein
MALTPVLGITGAESDAERERALEAGVDELLPRPLAHGRVVPAVVLRAARARRLDEVVRRDSLTGLVTVAAILDELESVLAFARRGGERLSFALFDVDHFRRLNEQLGHQRGDQILVHLARVIRDRVRASDLVVRMGGEEFGVLFRSCGPADASTVAEKVRAALAATPALIDGAAIPVRLSVGIAGYPDHAIGTRELVLAAERALRYAKETGRDRVAVGG